MGALFLAPVLLVGMYIGIGICEKKNFKLDEFLFRVFD